MRSSARGSVVAGVGLCAASAVLFSAKAIFVKLAYRYGVDAITLLTLRMLLSLPVFVGIAIFEERRRAAAGDAPLSLREWGAVAALGVCGYYLASYFDFAGLVGTVADTALPTVDLSGFQLPLPVSKAATTLSLHGSSRISESVKFNLGNAVEPRHLIGAESVEITDRQMTGETVVEAQLLAGVNWFSIAQARTRAALALVHGTTAGNIVAVDAPKVEIGRPAQGQSQMITNYTLPLLFCPDEGNDELVITAK